MAGRLRDKVAIVTGGGRGINEAVARLFAEEGARVAVLDLVGETAERTAAAIRDAGGEAIAIEGDVRVAANTERMAQRTLEAWGRIDILHNGAAVFLASDESSFVFGHNFVVGGGQTVEP